MDKCHSMGHYLDPLLPTCVMLDLTLLEMHNGCVKQMETGLEMSQFVKVSVKPTCVLAIIINSSHTVVDCGNLEDPNNGQVSLNATTFGSSAIYTCESGFNLNGNMQRMCQANGDWSGNEPVCEGM